MTGSRIIVLVLSLGVVLFWSLSWLPHDLLPMPLYRLLFWFGGLLTFLLLPAAAGLVWSLGTRPRPDAAASDAQSRRTD